MNLIQEIGEWVSTRPFTKESVDSVSLHRILEAGRKAPSAKNRQPWRFVVVQNETIRAKIESAAFGQEHVGQAPVIIAACSTNVDVP